VELSILGRRRLRRWASRVLVSIVQGLSLFLARCRLRLRPLPLLRLVDRRSRARRRLRRWDSRVRRRRIRTVWLCDL
jgi:hypothetical protein